METAPSLSDLVEIAQRRLFEAFDAQPQWIAAAPGRVNLIGEHTDYNDGFVLPMAIERYTVIAAAPGEGAGNVIDVASDVVGDRRTIRVGTAEARQLPSWCAYLHGAFDLLAQRGMATGPLRAVVLSTVPLGGGLSSSAALEVATATLVEAVVGRALDPRAKARFCQQVEHDYVGMPCGIMDQFASTLCREGEAMRLDCRSLETTPVPLSDPGVAVLIINSNVKHQLTGSEYPLRRAQCEQAAAALGVASLRDATMAMLLEAENEMDAAVFRRARHVLGENQRVLDFCAAAAGGDWPAAGALMFASHASLCNDFEVSCTEIDCLVAAARAMGVDGGVYGSRITGGGFGGCTVTLCRADAAAKIAERVLESYRQQFGIEGAAFVTRPARGAHVVRG